jgi:hypothetical protein
MKSNSIPKIQTRRTSPQKNAIESGIRPTIPLKPPVLIPNPQLVLIREQKARIDYTPHVPTTEKEVPGPPIAFSDYDEPIVDYDHLEPESKDNTNIIDDFIEEVTPEAGEDLGEDEDLEEEYRGMSPISINITHKKRLERRKRNKPIPIISGQGYKPKKITGIIPTIKYP